jgi:hypothetical protein
MFTDRAAAAGLALLLGGPVLELAAQMPETGQPAARAEAQPPIAAAAVAGLVVAMQQIGLAALVALVSSSSVT